MDDVVLRLILREEFKATLQSYRAEVRSAAQESQKMTSGLGNMAGALKTIAGTAAFAALVQGLRATVAAAAEAEAAQAKLVAALRATGRYSEDVVAGIDKWSMAFLRATGVSDELAKTLVAEGVAMGKTVEQSKRLAEAAANMAPIVGSVDGAFSLLIRASNGSTESLKRYGIQVTEAEAKSGDFESVLKRIEQQFAGQAQAGLNTYNGQMALLKENFGNLAEAIGGKMLPAANSWLKWINDAIAAHDRMTGAVDKLADAELRLEILRLNREKAQAGTLGHFDTDVKMVEERLRAAEQQLYANAKKRAADRFFDDGTGAGSTFAPTKIGTDGAKKAEEEAKRYADFLDTRYKNGTEAIDANTQALRENFFAWKEINDAAMAFERRRDLVDFRYNDIGNDSPEQQAIRRGNRTDLGPGYDFDAFEAGLLNAKMEADKLAAVFSDMQGFDLEALLDFQGTEQMTKRNAEAAKAAKDKASADMNAAQAAYGFAQTLVGLGAAISSGNKGGILSGFGGLAMQGGALTGNIPLFGLGALMSLGGGLLGDGQPRTFGGKKRQELGGILGDYGLGGGSSAGSQLAVEATGLVTVYDAWSRLLSGAEKDFGGGAAMLYDSFDDLDYSTRETADAVALMNAELNNTSYAVAQMETAWAGLNQMTALGLEEITALTDQFREGFGLDQQIQGLRGQLKQELTGGASYEQIKATQNALAGALMADFSARQAAEAKLRADLEANGMSGDDAQALIDENKTANQIQSDMLAELRNITAALGGTPIKHAGRFVQGYPSHLSWLRNDEDVVPPEKRGGYVRSHIPMDSYQPAGPVTIKINLDGREIASVVHRQTKSLVRNGEVPR